MRPMSDLAYTGKKAFQYEAKRAHTGKWKKENAAVSKLLEQCAPESIVDIPIGTGRFLQLYGNKIVYGRDLSQDMLDISRERYPDGDYAIADIRTFQLPQPVDVGVCMRLTGWLSPPDLEAALRALRKNCASLIIGIRTAPEVIQKGRLWVHSHAHWLQSVDRAGFIISGEEVLKSDSYSVYLCE